MPQSTHKSLIHILLCWITILTIIQVVFVILFFTVGHFGRSQDSGAVTESTWQNQRDNMRWPSSQPGVFNDKAKMFTFKGSGVHLNQTITWYAVDSKDLPTDDGQLGVLNIKKDGYYFICMQITLANCNRSEDDGTELDKVSLVQDTETILVGWINNKTCSTGLLCKMKQLPVGSALSVITSKPMAIDDRLPYTYLEAIYLPK